MAFFMNVRMSKNVTLIAVKHLGLQLQVQKLNDANGIGTPARRKIKTKTEKTKNQLKNFLTPRTAKGSSKNLSREIAAALGDEKKGWHANSYNVAQVLTRQVYNLFQNLWNNFLGFFRKIFIQKKVQNIAL